MMQKIQRPAEKELVIQFILLENAIHIMPSGLITTIDTRLKLTNSIMSSQRIIHNDARVVVDVVVVCVCVCGVGGGRNYLRS